MKRLVPLLVCLAVAGCRSEPPKIVVLTTVAPEFSRPVLAAAGGATGIEVQSLYVDIVDVTETHALRTGPPDSQPLDMAWTNNVLLTLLLEREGLLRPYDSPAGVGVPAIARSPSGMWHGLGARARVLIVNTNQLPEERRPRSIRDLTDPQWYERCGIARPTEGTAATHAACLFSEWGEGVAKDYFLGVKRTARIMRSERQVAQAVANGSLAFGLTDSDAAMAEVEAGKPVAVVYPDQRDDDVGTLFVPGAVAILANTPNPQPAERLLDYLVSADVERQLASSANGWVSLRPAAPAPDGMKAPGEVRAMNVDWSAVVTAWDAAQEFLTSEFATR